MPVGKKDSKNVQIELYSWARSLPVRCNCFRNTNIYSFFQLQIFSSKMHFCRFAHQRQYCFRIHSFRKWDCRPTLHLSLISSKDCVAHSVPLSSNTFLKSWNFSNAGGRAVIGLWAVNTWKRRKSWCLSGTWEILHQSASQFDSCSGAHGNTWSACTKIFPFRFYTKDVWYVSSICATFFYAVCC